jgi:hypothetical protein
MFLRKIFLGLVAITFVSGCASSKFKQRKEQRDSLVKGQGIYCDMINGDLFPDVEVQLNIEMAKRCDSNKNFSVTSYRAPTSDTVGIVYCCSLASAANSAPPVKSEAEVKTPAKKVEIKAEEKPESTPEKQGPDSSN